MSSVEWTSALVWILVGSRVRSRLKPEIKRRGEGMMEEERKGGIG